MNSLSPAEARKLKTHVFLLSNDVSIINHAWILLWEEAGMAAYNYNCCVEGSIFHLQLFSFSAKVNSPKINIIGYLKLYVILPGSLSEREVGAGPRPAGLWWVTQTSPLATREKDTHPPSQESVEAGSILLNQAGI